MQEFLPASLNCFIQSEALPVADPDPVRGGKGGPVSKEKFFGPGSTTDYPDLGSDMSLVWNFCAHSSDIIFREETSGNIDPKMLAVPSGYFHTAFNRRRRALHYKIFQSIR